MYSFQQKSTLFRLEKNEKAMSILKENVPALAEMAEQKDQEWCFYTLEELSGMHFINYDPQKLQKAMDEISRIRL